MMPLLLCPLGTNSCRADRRIMLRFEGEDVVMMRMQTSHGALPAPVTERGPVDGTIRGDTRCRGEDRRRHNFGGTRCGGGAMHTRREKSRETQVCWTGLRIERLG
ncbi:unnamed protein product [Ectocarpus fasciculatus]